MKKMTLESWKRMVLLAQRSFGKEVDEVTRGLIATVAQHLKKMLGSPETMPGETEIPGEVVPTVSMLSSQLAVLFKKRLEMAPMLTPPMAVGLVYIILAGRKVVLFLNSGTDIVKVEGCVVEVGLAELRVTVHQADIPAPPPTSPTWGAQPASAGVMNIDQAVPFSKIIGFEVVETGEDPR